MVVGGVKTPMWEVVKPGDKVIYGDYGSEKMPETFNKKAEALCDAIGVNFEKTEQGIRIVRIQDVRTVEKKVQPYLGVSTITMQHNAYTGTTPLPLLCENGTVKNG